MVIVTVTTHYYDGKKSFPIEIKLYQHSSSLAKGKDDEFFEKKTRYRNRANRPQS